MTAAFKRFIEWYLGIPPADPGQGTEWVFSLKNPWPDWMAPWAILLTALAIVGYVVWIYIRDSQSLTLGKRLLLISLRLATISLLLMLLTEMTLAVDRTGLPFVAVLVDVSASMSLEDQYPDAKVQKHAQTLIADSKHDGLTRINLATAILSVNNGRFLKRLQEHHKLRLYQFSDSASRLGNNEYVREDEIDELLPLLGELKAEGDQTRPGPAIRKVLNDFRGSPPSAIIILTDGITSTADADKLTVAAELALKQLVPIFPVALGSEEPARDLQLYDTLIDEVAFVDDPITFSTKLRGYGFKGRQVTVELKLKDSAEVLASKKVNVGSDGQPVKLEIPYTPPLEGEFDYVIKVRPLAKETNRENNSETRHVSVREGKIRVLLAESYPRWEFRELKLLLEREKTIELHTVLQDADLEFSDQDKTAKPLMGRFPVQREQLFTYDVVILGDVDPKDMSSTVFIHLLDFVREAGGALVMIAGENHNPLSYRNTPLEAMLPVELAGAKIPLPDIPITDAFRPVLTMAGRKGTNIFRFTENEQDSVNIWNNLPGFFWMFEAPERKRGAVVLVEHPTRSGAAGKLPVIIMQHFGAGKVLFHATDELWRWRFRVGDLYYGRYWIQAIRYLSRSRILGQSRIAELTADPLVFQRGETVPLRMRFLDERHTPVEDDGVTVMVERRNGAATAIKLTRLPQARSVFEGQLRHAAEGAYHAWVAAPSFKEAPPSVDFRVEAPRRELQKRSLDRQELTQTAKTTRGKYFTLLTAAKLPDDVPRGQPVPLESEDPIPLWNRWEIMFVFASLLTSEWLLRKRWRLI